MRLDNAMNVSTTSAAKDLKRELEAYVGRWEKIHTRLQEMHVDPKATTASLQEQIREIESLDKEMAQLGE